MFRINVTKYWIDFVNYYDTHFLEWLSHFINYKLEEKIIFGNYPFSNVIKEYKD